MIDTNLSFLQYCSNDDLKSLSDILTHNAKGEIRMSEQLTNSDAYVRCYPDRMKGMWVEIAEELQRFGGNTFANIFRGGTGVSYETILKDVCRKIKVKIPPVATVEEAEICLLTKYCEGYIVKMDLDTLHDLSAEIGIQTKDFNRQAMVAAILIALRHGGNKILGKVVYYIGANIGRILLGRGVYLTAEVVLGRSVGVLTGPVGWILTGAWLAWDIASPAYRVTIPAVIQVACMRFKHNSHFLTARRS